MVESPANKKPGQEESGPGLRGLVAGPRYARVCELPVPIRLPVLDSVEP